MEVADDKGELTHLFLFRHVDKLIISQKVSAIDAI